MVDASSLFYQDISAILPMAKKKTVHSVTFNVCQIANSHAISIKLEATMHRDSLNFIVCRYVTIFTKQ